MTTETPQQQASFSDTLRALIDDDVAWMEGLLSIETRSGEVVDLKLTAFQKWYLNWRNSSESKRRRVLVKNRQQLASSIILCKNFKKAVTVPGTKVLTMTHHDDATALFRLRVRQWCDQLSRLGALPEIEQDNESILSFKNTNSLMMFQTAGGRLGGRAAAYNTIHLSEVAFWPGDAAKILGGILPSAPADAEIDMESTPTGAGGPLHDFYIDAKAGELNWDFKFQPWYENEDYVLELNEGEEFSPTLEEATLKQQYNLTNAQLNWRRNKVAEMRRTKKDSEQGLFPQEYPEDDISCFLAGDDLVLDATALRDFVSFVRPPLINFEQWDIWKGPVDGVPYVIGVDSSRGRSDYSAATIMDAVSLEAVARYHARVNELHYAKVLDVGARAYNNALMVIETPGPGYTVISNLLNVIGYDNLYFYYNELTKELADEPGYPQNVKTRGLMIDLLQTMTQAKGYRTYDERTVRELGSLSWRKMGNMRNARAEAAAGAKDDLVFSIGLCLVGAKEAVRVFHQKHKLPGRNTASVIKLDPDFQPYRQQNNIVPIGYF